MKYRPNKVRARYGESLRSLGYEPIPAVADIIDNCIDANATEIAVEVNAGAGLKLQSPVSEIVIFDNGCGMDDGTSFEALAYGSNTGKAKASHMGCFGSGLKTAGTSLGRRITVITKTLGGKIIRLANDLDVNQAKKEFVTIEDPEHVTEEHLSRFDAFVGDGSGTMIIIDKIDRHHYKTAKGFVDGMKGKRALRLIFRKFLHSEQYSIRVNSTLLEAWGYDYVEGVQELMAPINFTVGKLNLGTIKLVSTLDTEHKAGHSREQGFVVLRNNRDITFGGRISWKDVYSHNWELSGVYAIWDVNAADFDGLMGTTLMKDSWSLPQNVKDSLTREIGPDLKSHILRREDDRKKRQADVGDTSLEDVTKTFENNLNSGMNITARPKIKNPEAVPQPERRPKVDKEDEVNSEEEKNETPPSPPRRVKIKDFEFPDGADTWSIRFEGGIGNGRYYQYSTSRRPRGGRQFVVTLDTDHEWVYKYCYSELNTNTAAMFGLFDQVVGDVYMELGCADSIIADNMVRSKSDYLRTRAKVTAAHDPKPVELAAK